jgi:hypothetical protein
MKRWHDDRQAAGGLDRAQVLQAERHLMLRRLALWGRGHSLAAANL